MSREGHRVGITRLLRRHSLKHVAWPPHTGLTKRLPVATFSKFLVVGGLGVVVNSLMLALLYQFAHMPLTLASVVAVETSIVHNYLWNDRWTFARESWAWSRLAKFNAVSLAGLVITTAVLWTLVTYFNMAYLLANVIGIGLATVWNFVVNAHWTWGASRRAPTPRGDK